MSSFTYDAVQESSTSGFHSKAQSIADHSASTQAMQRRIAQLEGALEEEEPLQGKMNPVQKAGVPINDDPSLESEADVMGAKAMQMKSPEDEELPVQGKFVSVAQKAEQTPNQTGLPDQLKSGVEQLSGHSLDDVKVHYNSSQPAQLNALAYAQGTDIHIAPGQEQHLPHEAWHVAQQKQGRVQPTMEG